LQTPVATILTHLEVLGLAKLSNEIRRESLGILKAETRRISRMINSMIKLGRIETGSELVELIPVDLTKIAETAVSQQLAAVQSRGMTINLKIIPPIPLINGNQDYLLQVFINLIDNSIKYSRAGDKIDIVIVLENQYVKCSIKDTGTGIAPEHLIHVAEYFYRAASEQTEGCGLGLTIVKEILKKLHSKLEMESATTGENKGTTIRFHFPAMIDKIK